MPDLGSSIFSQTDANNNSGTMPSWSGAAAPSTLDDAGRALQGAVTREWNWRNYTLTAGGSADAKTLTFSVAPAAYYNGQRFAFLANTTNTGSATLNVNSLGAKTIKKDLSGTLTNLSASDMVSGMFVEVAYNTANDCFVWVNRGVNIIGVANTWSAVQTFTASPVIEVTDNTNAALRVTQLGTGLALRIEDSTNPDSSPVVVDASGNVGIGTASPAGKLDVDGTMRATGAVTPSSGAGLEFLYSSPIGYIVSYDRTGAAFKSLNVQASDVDFLVSGATRLRIDSSGNILNLSSGGLGYGAGSGGTVTQITSRTTGVTINKTNGQITMFSAAGSTTAASFTVTNSTVAATDTIIVCQASGTNKYNINVTAVSAGSFEITFRTFSGTATDAPVLNFSVIKAVTS